MTNKGSSTVRYMLWSVTVFLLCLSITPARANVVNLNYEFTASDFLSFSNFGPGPIDPVTGSFSLSFDNAAGIPVSTTGFSLLINLSSSSQIGFLYDKDLDLLQIGGLDSGISGISGNTADFVIQLYTVSTAPTLTAVQYSVENRFDMFVGRNLSMSQTVPEPASLALLALGLAGLGAARHRRQR